MESFENNFILTAGERSPWACLGVISSPGLQKPPFDGSTELATVRLRPTFARIGKCQVILDTSRVRRPGKLTARAVCAILLKTAMNRPVLVLNGNYEPLNVCTTKRAMGLLLAGKATALENGRGLIHTVSIAYERPSVIRLVYVVRRPRPRVRLSKREILRRDAYRCQYCGRETTNLTLDHIIPRNRGGQHCWDNLVAACPQCNRRKGGRTLAEARMKLLQEPREPRPTARYLFSNYLRENEEWDRYVEGW
jgi:5-methylcytosine-specific restriction endonuclease McrA